MRLADSDLLPRIFLNFNIELFIRQFLSMFFNLSCYGNKLFLSLNLLLKLFFFLHLSFFGVFLYFIYIIEVAYFWLDILKL